MKISILAFIYMTVFTGLCVAQNQEFNNSVMAYSQDKMQVFVDVSVSYQLQNTSLDVENINRLLSDNTNNSIRLFCNNVLGAETFLLPETKQLLLNSLQADLIHLFSDGSVLIIALIINKIELSEFVMKVIEAKHRQDEAVAEQMAELEKIQKQMQQDMQKQRQEQRQQ